MLLDAAAQCYASALYEVGEKYDCIKALEQDFKDVWALMQAHPEIYKTLQSPVVSEKAKKDIIKKLFESQISCWLLYFLCFLVDKRRIDLLEGMEFSFIKLVEERANMIYAEVESAVPLLPQEEEALIKKLERFAKKTVKLKISVRTDLLGGLRIKLGDKYIDGSLEGQLVMLKERLVA